MTEFTQLPRKERAAVFEETAARVGIGRAAIVEKDFWVCWTLEHLFGPDGPADVTQPAQSLVFKGGTSLSKVYGLIDRFSEDVDLTVNRTLIIDRSADPEETGLTNRERKRRIKAMELACTRYVAQSMLPFLKSLDVGAVGIDNDPATLEFHYPRALADAAYGGGAYVNASIRLEFGARGDLQPSESGLVSSYAAQEFPDAFSARAIPVLALSPRRTFWEKATILHAISSHGKTTALARQSRHYSDLARIAASPIGDAALRDTSMLQAVTRHKNRFFASGGARYDLAVPGTLRLLPSAALQTELGKDYARMREMFIAEPPPFDQVMADIKALQDFINS